MTTGDHEWNRTGRATRVALVTVGLCLGALVLVMLVVVLVIGVPWGDAVPSSRPIRSGAAPTPGVGRVVGGIIVGLVLLGGAVKVIRATDWDPGAGEDSIRRAQGRDDQAPRPCP